jgi:hypothetical protein
MTDDEKTHAENAEAYRAKATELAETVRKSQKAYTALADNEDWLAKNTDKLA